MGGGGRHRAHLGSLVDAGAGSDVGAIPFSHSGVSFRQWQRVYQSHGGPVAQQIAGGANQVAATAQGKQKRVYGWYATPWQILRQLPGLAGFLRADLTVDQLAQTASAKSDTQAAVEMQAAKHKL